MLRLFFISTALVQITIPLQAQDSDAFFENSIRPLLVQHCVKCHGPKKAESGLRLDNETGALQGGDSGKAVVPKQPAKSLLIQAVRHQGGLEMPPNKPKLDERDIYLLERWVKQGAKWPAGMKLAKNVPQLRGGKITDEERAFWSFQRLQRSKPPRVTDVPTDRVGNDIDRFIQEALRESGLRSAAPASKRTLIRRATYDLTGLPPTPEQVHAFLEDSSPDAFSKLVDRLLESEAYGEKWGRHWLDVVRYADTAGETGDYPTPLSYKYRNYVINSFNKDKPYDQFIREQIAGDLFALDIPNIDSERYREMITATGFIAISRRFGFDVENYHHLTIQDTIDTIGQAVLGLSLGCARCHDHKYDPVNVEDYYAWYGIFKSTRYSFPGSEQKKRSYDSFPAIPPALATKAKSQHEKKLAKLENELKQLEVEKKRLQHLVAGSNEDSSLFAGFEFQPLNGTLQKPYTFLENVVVRAEAQSPFDNVFEKGKQGLASPSNAGNNAFGIKVRKHTAMTTPRLYYNIDFRLPSVKANAKGAFRFFVGHGPGISGAVELSASATKFYARNGGAYETVCDLKLGEWYNIQLAIDTRTRTYEGTIGSPGKLVRIQPRQFKSGWDGIIDRTFVDKYGAVGGTTPARHIDNLSLKTTPMLPVGKSVDRNSQELAVYQWQSYIEKHRIKNSQSSRENFDGLNVWHNDPLPIIAANSSKKFHKIPGNTPPNSVVVHPGPKNGIGIGWQSPISGRIRVTGKVKDAHHCGDSVLWFVDHLTGAGFAEVAKGANPPNGSTSIHIAENKPIQLAVRQGDFVQLAILPKANYGCDLTQIELQIDELDETPGRKVTSEKKLRTWNLVNDVVLDLHKENPNSDQYGNGVWYFYECETDRGQSVRISTEVLAEATAQKARDNLKRITSTMTRMRSEVEKMKLNGPYELIYGAIERDKPADARIQIRGERDNFGAVVPRKNLEILGNDPLPKGGGSGRKELANWLLRDSNPLTARVMVNRIWQHHFGQGIVSTENDFGARGAKPSHPQLLDWLAIKFIESGWSIKSMHRLIMASAAYQQSSENIPMLGRGMENDPNSQLLWRFRRRRLSAEEIRDSMLFVSGNLDNTIMQEPHPFPLEKNWAFSQHAPYYGLYPTNRRSVYLMQQRLKRHPFLGLFDGADVNVSIARRELTTVPTQALYLMNSEFVHGQAKSLALRIAQQSEEAQSQINRLFETTLGRKPTAEEIGSTKRFLDRYEEALATNNKAKRKHMALAAFCRTLLSRNEFLFVD